MLKLVEPILRKKVGNQFPRKRKKPPKMFAWNLFVFMSQNYPHPLRGKNGVKYFMILWFNYHCARYNYIYLKTKVTLSHLQPLGYDTCTLYKFFKRNITVINFGTHFTVMLPVPFGLSLHWMHIQESGTRHAYLDKEFLICMFHFKVHCIQVNTIYSHGPEEIIFLNK